MTSTDPFPGGVADSYAWTWGDGTSSSMTTAAAPHTYAKAGTYPATLTVTACYGRSGSARQRWW